MKKIAKSLLAFFSVCCLIFLSFSSCNKEEDEGLPPKLFVMFSDSTNIKDTSIEAGKSIQIIVKGCGSGSNITYFSLIRNGVHVLDSGLNSSEFISNRLIVRGTDSIENYTVLIRDRKFNEATFSFSIGLKPTLSYGSIRFWPNIILGAQNNTSVGSFFNLFSGQIYNLQQAYSNQDSVQLLYYYDVSDFNTISSPNANIDTSYFGGSYGLAHWTHKNEVRFVQINNSESEFLAMQNDSLIIANIFPYSTGKRKAKSLHAGSIYAFSIGGLYGILFVNNVNGQNSGTIDISIKIQE